MQTECRSCIRDPFCSYEHKPTSCVNFSKFVPAVFEVLDVPTEAMKKEIEPGDLFFDKKGNFSHSHPTVWLVLCSNPLPNEDGWACAQLNMWDGWVRHGIGAWNDISDPGSHPILKPHIIMNSELLSAEWLGNIWDAIRDVVEGGK